MQQGLIREDALTVNGKTIGENCRDATIAGRRGDPALRQAAEGAMPASSCCAAICSTAPIMKTSVISPEFRERYLSNPDDPEAFEGRAVVFDGPEDYHHRIDDPALGIDEHTHAVHARRRPDRLSRRGRGGEHAAAGLPDQARASHALPCIGDGRQSGTSGSPSILNASPEAAAGGGLALLQTGDRVRIDLNKRRGRHPDLRRGARAAPRRRWRRRAATPIPATRRPGRRSSAASSASSATAWC